MHITQQWQSLPCLQILDPYTRPVCTAGELHAYHPAVAALASHVDAQRASAEAQHRERESRVAQYVLSLRSGSLSAQAQLLGAMQGAWGRA